jgi:predicted MFS family arabinose efflux permease
VSRIIDLVAPPRMGVPFRWNLASVWVGNIGDGIALAAGPLLVASQTRNPALIAAAAMASRVPNLFIGLFAGALADRVDRKRLVIVANLLRAVVLAGLILTIVTGWVSIWAVLVALLLVGTAEQFADSGTRAVLPMIVPKADLGIGSARQMAGYLVANELLGPPIGAFLFAVGMAAPFGAQAAAVLLAAWLFTRVELPTRGSQAKPDQHIGRDVAEGLRWIWGNKPVRTLSLIIFIFNLTWGAPWGILVLWAQDQLGVGAVGYGLLSTAIGLGGILAVLSYDWLEKRVSLATLMKACLTLEVLLHLALANTRHEWLALVLMFVFGSYAFVWGSVSNAVRMRATPMAYQGRVSSVYFFGLTSGLLVGQFLGGLIATRWGVAAPFWFAFVGAGVTLLLVWRQLGHIAHADADEPDAGATA